MPRSDGVDSARFPFANPTSEGTHARNDAFDFISVLITLRAMVTRRIFLGGAAAGLGLAAFAPAHAFAASPERAALSPGQRRWLLAALAQQDPRYDPFAKLLVTPDGGIGYHGTATSQNLHGISPSLVYAAALFDSAVVERGDRAREIVRLVVSLQDQDPDSKSYGLWPWHLEQPLARLPPAEWDGADFCAVPLLMIWIGHRQALDETLAGNVRAAILHAASSIQRREWSTDTNCALVRTSIALLAAQEFKRADLRVYAKDRLRRLHAHLVAQGSLAEYNSPADAVVTLQELSRMLRLVKDSRDRNLVQAMHDLAWQPVATHFHAPTHQWAGPHGRCDETDLRHNPAALAFLQTAGRGQFDFKLPDPLPLSLAAAGLPLEIPRKLLKQFVRLDSPREVIETFVRADRARSGSKNPIVGTTWLHPRFALGSINRGDCRRQRRPLVAYWGTAASCRFLRVRFLKDGRDFSSALFFSAQHENTVLAAIAFAIDHGDTDPILDPLENGAIKARDLRLRIEFGGDLQDLAVRSLGGSSEAVLIQDRECRFLLHPIAGAFGGKAVRWDAPTAKLADQIDAMTYAGEGEPLLLAQQGEAFLCFALQEWPYEERKAPVPAIDFKRVDGRMQVRWNTGRKTLELAGPLKPDHAATLNDAFLTKVGSA